MSVDDIDRLEREVDGLLRRIAKLAKPKRSAEVDDTSDDDDVPDEADDPDNPNEDDDEDDDGDSIQKFSETYHVNRNDSGNRPGALATSDHPQRRHKLQELAADIENTEGLPKTEALAEARRRHPQTYADFVRPRRNNTYFKSAAPTFEDLVAAEMRKGVNAEVAGQRVLQQYGSAALHHRPLAKRADLIEDQLTSRAEDIWANSDLDHCESLRKARREMNPKLMKALQGA